MAISIEFDGRFRGFFKNVIPGDIILRGKNLYIQGRIIPIAENTLYDAFRFFERETNYKYGKLIVVILNNGDIEYTGYVTNSFADYHIGNITTFGVTKYYHPLVNICNIIPEDDEYMVGRSRGDY